VTRRLLVSYLTVTAFVLLVLEVPLGVVFARLERNSLIADVRHDADAVALFAAAPLERGDVAPLQTVAHQYDERSDGRLVIVDARGELAADSAPIAPGPRTFRTRPEFDAALRGRETSGFRSSSTLGNDIFFVALPVNTGGRVVGAVRITYPASFVHSRIVQSWLVLALAGLGVLAVVAAISRSLARSITAPLNRLEVVAQRLGDGDLEARVGVGDTDGGVPEVRVLARVLNDTAAKLDRLLASQREFVADASHQLRTPLTALRLRLEVAEMGAADDGVTADVHAALAEVYRLTRLVDGLLALARADSGTAVPAAVDVGRVAEERRRAWAPLAEEHGVALTVRAPRRVYASATPGALEQALDNLVANAVDASPAGSTVLVAVRADRDDAGVVHVHVVDEGPGMDDAARARAFERFWSGDESVKRVGGTGIGLSIVARLVRADGGDVSLDRAPGGGLDAHLRLRRAAAPVSSRRARPSAPAVS
jgi:signal transduction histidine kinase